MDFIELAKQRFSCRSYQNKTVDEGKLLKVLEVGRIAPSAVNNQPWHFVILQAEEKRIEKKSVRHIKENGFSRRPS